MSVQPVVDALPLLGCTVRDVRRTHTFGRGRAVRLTVESPNQETARVLAAVVVQSGGTVLSEVHCPEPNSSRPLITLAVSRFSFPYHEASELLSLT